MSTSTTAVSPDLDDVVTETAEAAELPLAPGPVLPRVNLLPPEIAEGARLQRLQLGLGTGVLAVAGIVTAMHLAAAGSVTDAQTQLDAANRTGAGLQADSRGFDGVLDVYAQAEASRTMLTAAMGQEVRFSELLDRLTRSVPDNVWLKNVEFSQTSAAGSAGEQVAVGPGVGTATFTGMAFRHDDVAAWLDSLGTHEAYADATLSDSTVTKIGTRSVVTFTSTVTLTPAALSNRWTTEGGG